MFLVLRVAAIQNQMGRTKFTARMMVVPHQPEPPPPPRPVRHDWTAAEVRTLVEGAKALKTAAELCAALPHIPPHLVRARLITLGRKKRLPSRMVRQLVDQF